MNPTFNKQNYHGATNAGLPVKPKWKYDGGDSEHFDKLQKQARDILSLHGLAQTLKNHAENRCARTTEQRNLRTENSRKT
jgi:hypothetical protein